MCRFVLYLGPTMTLDRLLTLPTHSLVRQSFQARERREPLNGDGFGVAWYVPELSDQPAAFRSIRPAWNNSNLHDLCRVTRSAAILAHVRAASPGLPVTATNCHPFTQGPFAFMHNGHVSEFLRVRRELLGRLSDESFAVIKGSTDSEHLFAMFLDRHRQGGGEGPEGLAGALEGAIGDVLGVVGQEPCTLNLAVSDGCSAAVTRFASGGVRPESLYVHEGKEYVLSEDGECRMEEPEGGRGSVLISSEPLSGDPGWDLVPANHVVLVDAEQRVWTRPVALAGAP